MSGLALHGKSVHQSTYHFLLEMGFAHGMREENAC
jgi:hypothetical protein